MRIKNPLKKNFNGYSRYRTRHTFDLLLYPISHYIHFGREIDYNSDNVINIM